jgi:hypothetical protein
LWIRERRRQHSATRATNSYKVDMTPEQPAAPEEASPPGGDRHRPAPTIDLSATEVEAAPAGTADDGKQREDAAGGETRAAPPPPRRGGWWPGLIAGAVAGTIAGICIPFLLQASGVLPAGDGGTSALDARLSRVEAKLGDGASPSASAGVDQKAFDDLAGRVAKLESTVTASRPGLDTQAANRIATVEGDLKALTETVGILARRSDELAANAHDAGQRADTATAAVADLKAVPRAPAAASNEKLEGEIQTLSSRAAAVESELAKRAGAQSSDRSGRFAVAAAALAAAVERGHPFAAELAAVSTFSPDPKLLAPLSPFAATGVPTAAVLAGELSALMPSLVAAAEELSPESSFLERLEAHAAKLVRIHRTQEAPGSDPATVVERIEIKAGKGDIAGALAELATLPPAVRAPAAGWMEKAQKRSAAVEASRQLTADALAGLSK